MPVDGASGCLGSLMRLKQRHEHLQIILSIGGGSGSQNFASVASSAGTRDNFGKSAKGLIEATGFDGIDSQSSYKFNHRYISNLLLQSIGSIRLTPNRGGTSSLSLLPSESTSPIKNFSSQPPYQPDSGLYNTLISIEHQTTSISLI